MAITKSMQGPIVGCVVMVLNTCIGLSFLAVQLRRVAAETWG